MRTPLIESDGELAFVIPQEILDRLGLKAGDTVFATEIPGGLHITRHDPSSEGQKKNAKRAEKA